MQPKAMREFKELKRAQENTLSKTEIFATTKAKVIKATFLHKHKV